MNDIIFMLKRYTNINVYIFEETDEVLWDRMVLMIMLVDGQGKYGVIILYERRMEMKEEEASEKEEGLEEPKDVEV